MWNVPNGAFPHLASSIHQPTIPSGIVILAIVKCTTDAKKKIQVSPSRQHSSRSWSQKQTGKQPRVPLSHLAANLQHCPAVTGQRGEEGQVSDWEFRPCTAWSSCFWLGVSRMTHFRSVQMLVNSLVHFFFFSPNDTGPFPAHALIRHSALFKAAVPTGLNQISYVLCATVLSLCLNT